MDLETRLTNLEKLVNALSKRIDTNKYYQDADNDGMRKGINNVTPKTYTKTGYIGDSEVVFADIPRGNTAIYFGDKDPDYSFKREDKNIVVKFKKPLEEVIEVTLQIL